MHDQGRKIIGFLRHNFLPPEETFIYTSLRAVDRYGVSVFALRRQSAAKYPHDDVVIPGALARAAYRVTTWCPQLERWARRVRLIHAHFGYTGAHAMRTARRFGLPLVTSFYGHDVTLRGSARMLDPTYWHYGALARQLFRRGDRFLALSRHMERALIAQGFPGEKIRVVPLGVDLARFAGARLRPPGARFRVLMVGREHEKKGFDDGLHACAQARARGLDLEVVVLGTGEPGRADLIRLGADLGLDVAWPDPSAPVPAAMADADVLLVPSRTTRSGDQEGTPTVICEGSAAGLPVVSTRHAGIPEQVDDGVTGLLVGERDRAAMADALVRLAADPARRRVLGDAGRAKMRREYSIEAHRQNLQTVYDELLS